MDAAAMDPATSEDNGTYPFTPGAFGGCPAAYARRRVDSPVSVVALPSGDAVLLVTRFDDIREVHSNPHFSRNLRYPGAPRMLAAGDFGEDPNSLVNMDPPEHARLRRIVQGAFTPRAAEKWRPQITEIADGLLDAMIDAGSPADLRTAFAFPLPVEVICRLLGVPPKDSPLFREWSDRLLSLTAGSAEERLRAGRDFSAYVDGLVADHRRGSRTDPPGEPARNDLIDELIAARDEDEERLGDGELANMVRGLIIAGHETTANVISRGTLALLRRPGALAELRAGPERVAGTVEEILRVEIPGHGALLRVAKREVRLPSGAVVGEGRGVLAPFVAANHDPLRFPDPEAFDPARTDNRHLTFGIGPHYCLGANLARVELQVAIEALARRLPDLQLDVPIDELTWSTGSRVCGLTALPVRW
ncbi:cytochrome P450 [Streptomyces boluensis]|uniref:Cytochrome P450 n=1 Tax=Streptomyces boluensis TaxID=1775135 RepID=A0A964UQ36_9ACTN|nr:cytochrome P450 [Streptomyces boluensis]NBE51928.1 cytochrome P450 [Streptomyces boluensis]